MNRPLLITGTPRSGKSCVANILKQAPEFAYLNEPVMLWDVGRSGGADDRLTAADASASVRIHLRERCEAAVRAAGRDRYLDNLSHHALAIPFVHAVLPEARIIHVVRDPARAIPEMTFGWTHRDTVRKAMSRRRRGIRLTALPRQLLRFGANYVRSRVSGRRSSWGPRVPGMAKLPQTCSAAEMAAFQWEQMMRIAREDLGQLPAEAWMEVRLDDLLANPVEIAGRLAKFAEVSDPAAIVSYAANFIEPGRVFEKVVSPSADEWRTIWKRVETIATELGYTVPSAASQLKEEHE